jgi:hypothetical protein
VQLRMTESVGPRDFDRSEGVILADSILVVIKEDDG